MIMRNTLLFALSVLSLSVQQAVAEVKHISDHGFIIENTIKTDASIEDAWLGLTKHVNKWWPKDHSWWYGTFSIEDWAGGCFCEVNDKQTAEHMRVVFVDPHKVLRMIGGLGPLQGMGMNGALNWNFSELEDGATQVVLTYSVTGINPDGFEQLAPIVDQVQGIQLNGLASYLENNKPSSHGAKRLIPEQQ
jgi:hypothetical protein